MRISINAWRLIFFLRTFKCFLKFFNKFKSTGRRFLNDSSRLGWSGRQLEILKRSEAKISNTVAKLKQNCCNDYYRKTGGRYAERPTATSEWVTSSVIGKSSGMAMFYDQIWFPVGEECKHNHCASTEQCNRYLRRQDCKEYMHWTQGTTWVRQCCGVGPYSHATWIRLL